MKLLILAFILNFSLQAKEFCIAARAYNFRKNPGHVTLVITERGKTLHMYDSHGNRDIYSYKGDDALTRLDEYLNSAPEADFTAYCTKLTRDEEARLNRLVQSEVFSNGLKMSLVTGPEHYKFFKYNCVSFVRDFYNTLFIDNGKSKTDKLDNLPAKFRTIFGTKIGFDNPNAFYTIIANLVLNRQRIDGKSVTFRHKFWREYNTSGIQRNYRDSVETRNAYFDYITGRSN